MFAVLHRLVPPTVPHPTLTQLVVSVLKSTINAAVILIPAFKSFKALESGRLHPARQMLVYWCSVTFLNAAKSFVDELAGKYSSHTVYVILTYALKLLPMLLGEQRIFAYFVAPFFKFQEDRLDFIHDELHTMKREAAENAKEFVEMGKGKMEEIIETAKETITGERAHENEPITENEENEQIRVESAEKEPEKASELRRRLAGGRSALLTEEERNQLKLDDILRTKITTHKDTSTIKTSRDAVQIVPSVSDNLKYTELITPEASTIHLSTHPSEQTRT